MGLEKYLRNDKGSALIVVLLVLIVIMSLSIAALEHTVSQKRLNRAHLDSGTALHFAESGIHEFLWHLNKEGSSAVVQNRNNDLGNGFYRIEFIDGSQEDGWMKIRSTGHVKGNENQLRTVEAILTKTSFTEYVWFSNTEGDVWNTTQHTWNGPFHTNGNLNVWGRPTFNGTVTYAGTIMTHNAQPHGTANPIYNGGSPRQVQRIELPTSNNELRLRAQNGGHYYNGMTAIYLRGNVYDVRTYNRNTGRWYFNGVPYTFESGSDSKPNTPSLPLPANGVIFVDGSGTTQWNRGTGDLYISGQLNGRLTIAAANDIFITGWDPTDWRQPIINTNHNPRNIPRGNPTVGIRYQAGTENTSMLGLVAGRNVEFLNRDWPRHNANNDNSLQRWTLGRGSAGDVAPFNLEIHGAIMALRGSVQYNHLSVVKGNVTIRGAVIQNTRGAFATYSGGVRLGGYGRISYHDPRMTYNSPPFFLEPQNSGWHINRWKEVNDHVQELP